MTINYEDISLRDYSLADIHDDIRWLNVDNDWRLLDTPWALIDEVDEDEYFELMEFHVQAVSKSDEFRSRLEIYCNEKHIGFVSAFYCDDKCELTDSKRATQIQLSVQICQKEYRAKGYGKKALSAYIDYCKKNTSLPICIKTHSENIPMLKLAVKLKFEPYARDNKAYTAFGKVYDVIYMKLKNG